MLIEVILQSIFIILSIMVFKSDDNFDFNLSTNHISKAINVYKLFNIVGNNYHETNELIISVFEQFCKYCYIVVTYVYNMDFTLIL
jgi:hypothetical protein